MSAQQNGVISIQPKTVEAAEAVIKRLFAKHARVRARIDELTAEHRTAAYHVHVNSDADAYKRLDRINDELAQRKRELHDLDAALVEAHARRDAAQLAVAKSDAARRIRHAGELLISLETIAATLDEGVGTADVPPHAYSAAPTSAEQQRRYYANPPAQVETGRLVGELFDHLHGLGLGGNVVWPPMNWSVLHRSDLQKRLETTISTYQGGQLASRQRNSFAELLGHFAAAVRRDLQRIAHEPEAA
jgi:hypothetical protein